MTLDGIYTSGLAWTRTVPRRLYERETGRIVTQQYPGLIYPYHSYEEMQAAGYSVATKGPVTETPKKRKLFRKKAKSSTLLSTKQAPRKPAAEVKRRYVQVGAFSTSAKAETAAARLRAKGIPARLGTLNRGTKSYRVVLAGPYASNQLDAGLKSVRRAGYRDAFIR